MTTKTATKKTKKALKTEARSTEETYVRTIPVVFVGSSIGVSLRPTDIDRLVDHLWRLKAGDIDAITFKQQVPGATGTGPTTVETANVSFVRHTDDEIVSVGRYRIKPEIKLAPAGTPKPARSKLLKTKTEKPADEPAKADAAPVRRSRLAGPGVAKTKASKLLLPKSKKPLTTSLGSKLKGLTEGPGGTKIKKR